MRFIILIPALLLCFFTEAQITISSSEMPVAGDTFYSYTDTLPTGFSIGQKGANRTWDFSNLTPDYSTTTYAVDRTTTPYSTDFPNATFALTTDNVGYFYYRNTGTALKVEGFANLDPNLGIVSVNFNPIPDQYRFPIAYQGNFSAGSNGSGGSGFQEAKAFNQLPASLQAQITAGVANCPNPNADVTQVRVTFTSSYTDTIDAWGTVTTPIGTYDALRRKRVENSHTIIEAYTNCLFVYNWFPIVDTTSTTTEHMWLSPITKLPLVTLGYDGARNITSVSYASIPPPPVANFTWNNPSGGLVNFTNTSQNTPTTFAWDFGDGGTSSTQSPAHIYFANGSYYVCLTVTNVSGTDTFCDSVHVTGISPVNNAPVAVRDSVQTLAPASVQISLLANDIDPDGDNIIYNFFFPPLNGTVTHLGNGVVEYEPNTNFRGVDSFQYKISDDGSPVKSDTGSVVVRVDGVPFADFTFTANQLTVQFVNTSSGFDSVSWDLGDGNSETTNTVIHSYANSGTYNVCLTATNAFGSDDTCQTVDVATGISQLKDAGIILSPNPSSGEVRIEFGKMPVEKVEVFDLSGKVLWVKYPFSNTEVMTIDLYLLSQGLYICRLTGADGKVVTGKLVRE